MQENIQQQITKILPELLKNSVKDISNSNFVVDPSSQRWYWQIPGVTVANTPDCTLYIQGGPLNYENLSLEEFIVTNDYLSEMPNATLYTSCSGSIILFDSNNESFVCPLQPYNKYTNQSASFFAFTPNGYTQPFSNAQIAGNWLAIGY